LWLPGRDMGSISDLLTSHLGASVCELPVLRQSFEDYERPNLHLAIEELTAADVRLVRLFGVVERDYHVTLSRLTSADAAGDFREGPVEYIDLDIGPDASVACVKRGVYLLREESHPLAMLISNEEHSYPPKLMVEVMAADRSQGQNFLRRLTRLSRLGKAYRG